MSDINQPQRFGFPIAWLNGYVRRFQAALRDPAVGPQVLAHLVRTFQADLDAQVEILANAASAQLQARAAGHAFTRAQNESLDDIVLLSFNARDAAKAVFTGQDAVLHSEFMVGQHKPEDLDSILHRAEIIAASCQKYAELLALEGWSPEHTQMLASAIIAVKTAEDNQQLTSDDKEGCTARQIAEANRLYRMSAQSSAWPASCIRARKRRRIRPSTPPARSSSSASSRPAPAPPRPPTPPRKSRRPPIRPRL